MLLLMIEKELKQFFRNKGAVIILLLFPLVLITCLGFCLNSFMSADIDVFSEKKVLYHIENNSKYEEGFNGFKEEFQKEASLEFEEINDMEKAKVLVNENKAIALVTIDDNGYEYYRSESGEYTTSKIFRSVLEQTLTTYALVDTVIEENPTMIKDVLQVETRKYVEESSIGGKGISSFEYYTFAELALIILYISIMVAESVYNEGKLKTINRIRLSKVSELKLIISKAIVGIMIGVLQILEVYLFSTFVLKVNWGENLLVMVCVLLALVVFSSILGIVIGLLVKESKGIQSSLQTIIMALCFTGGCYAPLSMLKSLPIFENVMMLSPIYWVNSALVSLNTGVINNYSTISIVVCLGASIGLVCIYMIIKKVRGGRSIA